jgi:hypothetical protein
MIEYPGRSYCDKVDISQHRLVLARTRHAVFHEISMRREINEHMRREHEKEE